VSIATFKLSKVEAIYQSEGFNSCLRAQCSGVSTEECGSIPWDEFQVRWFSRANAISKFESLFPQSKFSSRTHAWSDERNLTRMCSIKARLERKPDVAPVANLFAKADIQGVIQHIFTEHLDAEVKNVNLTLSLTSGTGLAELLKDEILPKPMPMSVRAFSVPLKF